MDKTTERALRQKLEAELKKPPRKKDKPDYGTKQYIVWAQYDLLKQLRDQAKRHQKLGRGWQHTWTEISEIFSETTGTPFTANYLRKLFYLVGEKYYSASSSPSKIVNLRREL